MNLQSHPGFCEFSQLNRLDLNIEWCKTVQLINFVHPNKRKCMQKLLFYASK